MKKEQFYVELADALEIDDVELQEDTNLNDFEEYDSLAILSIIALADEEFGIKISGSEFKEIATVKDLINKIGEEKFE